MFDDLSPAVGTLGAVRFSDVAGSDPLTGALTQLLTVPVRELYAVLWRIGVIDVESAR